VLPLLLIALAVFAACSDTGPGPHQYGNYRYLINETGTITIDRYTGPGGSVTIRAKIAGKPVTSIGNWAFSYNQLTGVIIIPDSVTSIGDDAFSFNRLTIVIFGNSVTSIGASAFFGNQLTSVTIGNSVTSVGAFAFFGNQLTSVTIGADVTLATGDLSSFGGGLEEAYSAAGKIAGTYTRPDTDSTDWTRQEEILVLPPTQVAHSDRHRPLTSDTMPLPSLHTVLFFLDIH
jgi:acetyltransferase-like isoleucine patch superfamily enzyme